MNRDVANREIALSRPKVRGLFDAMIDAWAVIKLGT
jgi:hypothetical protein